MSNCKDPACHDGYIHEDGDVSACMTCSQSHGEDPSEDPLIARLIETASDAMLALDNMAADAEARGDMQAAHFARHRVDALDGAIAEVDARRIASMTDDEVAASLAKHGISTADIERGVSFVQELCRAHREASRRAAERKCSTMADVDSEAPPDDIPFASEPTNILRFELDMVDVYIGDLWRAVFGPDKPLPNSGTTRLQALSRIMGNCLNVEWPWRKHRRPALRVLPAGVELDE